jgi:hypothetical protein
MVRRVVSWIAAVLCLCAASAHGEAINLSWNTCASGPNAADDVTFACDDESKVMVLVGSFYAPAGIGQFIGLEASIQVLTDSGLPDFWQLGTDGCRSTSATPQFAFPGMTGCTTPWNTQTLGFWDYSNHDPTVPPGRGHMRVDAVRPANQALQLAAGREYYAFQMKITMDQVTTCQGCRDPACFVLNSITLYQPSDIADPSVITTPAARNYVTWQGGGNGSGCTAAGAKTTKKMTWGQIKGIYR